MKYLSYFENQDQALSYDGQLGAPHVSYIEGGEQLLFAPYTEGVEEVKFKVENGQLVLQDKVDPVPGFVDLGLSVMWASCDVGATSPEGEGTKYTWGEESWDTIPLEFDPVYMNSNMKLKEVLQPRTPSPAQVQELLDNTTATEEVLNGASGIRYTASNGNSIFVANAERWTNAKKYLVSSWYNPQAVCWNGSVIIDNQGGSTTGYNKTQSLSFRGICTNLPTGGAEFIAQSESFAVNSDKLYCLPKNISPVYITSNVSNLEMSTSNQPFAIENALYTYSFKEDGGTAFGLTSGHLSIMQSNLIDDYIYVKFSTNATITLNEWNASACIKKSIPIYPNETFTVTKNNNTIVYRFKYDDFAGYGFVLKWANTLTELPTYIADTCTFGLTSGDTHVIRYTNIREGGQMTIKPDVYEGWASRVDADGYLYVRFDSKRAGNVTFVTDKPAS